MLRGFRQGLKMLASRLLADLLFKPKAWRLAMRRQAPRRLQVGCGNNRFEGWINADITPSSELIVFFERRLPFPDQQLSRIYLEHALEHVSYEVGVDFLREAHRVLEPGGILRVALPDLEELVSGYFHGDWKSRFGWTQWPEYAFLKSRAQMINVGFRWWGHQHLYDREELERALREAGFGDITFCRLGESVFDDLRGLETREDSCLIAEAVRT